MKQLKNAILEVQKKALKGFKESTTLENLEAVRVIFLGRKGEIANLMPLLKNLSVEEKREFGPALNELKQVTEKAYQTKKDQLQDVAFEQEEEQYKDFDVTSYKPHQAKGSLHLYTQATEKIEDILISMGYTLADGPEVETDYFNFEALNIPKNHPARDSQDTFFMNVPGMVMRTHTSPVQIRAMKNSELPVSIACIGRTFRHEATDASHDYMFRQIEGLVVGKDISLSHLLGTLKTFLQKFFEKKDLKLRARPGYFPFVEPGLEIDMSCPFCTKGCSTCKHTCWIETLGAGLVHPEVLKHGGIDPKKYTGFAFGCGLTRLVMIKYGINDIRLLHNAHIEFLKQF
jgi:phenylalanyl-tRNA synthetase alpha chain